MVEKSDKIWWIKHVRKFDEQNFDELSCIFVPAAKNKYYLQNYHMVVRVEECIRFTLLQLCIVSMFI